MRILFLHQNFPGQFRQVALALQAAGDHDLMAVVPADNQRTPIIPLRHYQWKAPDHSASNDLAVHYATSTSRASAVADALLALKAEGSAPDLVVGHGGWGETLFVHDVWPDVPILLHAEFWYRGQGLDVGFNSETTPADAAYNLRRVRARSAVMLQALSDASRGVAPTQWQASTFPEFLRPKIEVMHEGIDTDAVQPDPAAFVVLRRVGICLRPGDEVVTYVSRGLEHYRGFHIFMRMLPAILAVRPQARIVIVGGDDVSYGPRPPAGKTWRQVMLDELAGRLDLSRIHFVGRVPYARFIALMQVSAAHVYLTYPFVLSWSVLEAMSAGALVIGSRTAPVQEVIEDGRNGVLRDFFDTDGLADAVIEALAEPRRFMPLRLAARETIVDRYDLTRVCLPGWLDLVDRVARTGSKAAA